MDTLTERLLYRVEEVLKLLAVSRQTLYSEMAAGRIVPVRIRGAVRFTREEIDRYIAANTR